MKKIHLCISILFLFSLSTYAQKEAYNWFYGSGQGITWNKTQQFQGEPIDAPNTSVTLEGIPTRYEPYEVRPKMYPVSTHEGCFSLSDEYGNLLFYSSGSIVYNSAHEIMENATGLSGHTSSAQSGIIIPYPRNKKKYIMVSIGIGTTTGYRGSLSYNVLDIAANDGLGKVELPKNREFVLPPGALKNQFIESLAATKHANGVDYWIIAIQRYRTNSKMVAWLLTQDGISTTPVTSPIPVLDLLNGYTAYGYLKISPNAKYFAVMMHEKGNFFWGDFDNKTGLFSNIDNFSSNTRSSLACYGAEFSPDSNYLYIGSGINSYKIMHVFDFRELMKKNVSILKTYEARSTGNSSAGALQLGPDMRIYMTSSGGNPGHLYMIEEPNEPLTTKVYKLKNLSPGTGHGADGESGTRFGLPTFAASFFVQIEGTSSICVGEQALYTLNSNAERIEVDFDEGDGPIIIDNVSELKHSFKKPGNYLIKVRPLNSVGDPIQDEIKTIYTTVYGCYLPVNHNLINAEY